MKTHLAGLAIILALVAAPAAGAQPQNTSQTASRLRLQVPPDQHVTYVSAGARFRARGNVRPEVAQSLTQAVQLASKVERDPTAIIEKFNQAAATPDLNHDEESAVQQAGIILFGTPLASRFDPKFMQSFQDEMGRVQQPPPEPWKP
jgi:hypothetical protein